MSKIAGSLDRSGSPTVRIAMRAKNARSFPTPARNFDAVIDTGFTGFVQIPASEAKALRLVQVASSDVEYGDGRVRPVALAWTEVELTDHAEEGFVHLQKGIDEVRVGLEFLRIFHKTLVLSVVDQTVLLVDAISDLLPNPR
jgi:predicted aspartyl protease